VTTTGAVAEQIGEGDEVALHIRQPKLGGLGSYCNGRFASEVGSELLDLHLVEGRPSGGSRAQELFLELL
jgi:hypothetical protein